MKYQKQIHAEHRPCFDGICETMDRLGVPRNSKWRALILFMRSIKDYDIYTPEQKRRMQDLVVKALKDGDLTEQHFAELSRQTEEIITSPWRSKLQFALGDLSRAIGASRAVLHKRKGDLQQLESATVESVQSGKDLDAVLEDIRRGFQDMVRYIEEDAEELERLSFTDSLTNLSNRRAFEEALAKAVERHRTEGSRLCVLMADVDRFKDFNDRHGHLIGDQALSAVAAVIRDCQRQEEEAGRRVFSARYGGEEFTVIAQDMEFKQAMALAERIRQRIESYDFVIRGVDGDVLDSGIKLTISLGVACMGQDWTESLEQHLVNAADEALYAAKQAGRNKVIPYEG